MASSHQDSAHEQWSQRRRALRRRWLLIGALTFTAIAWGPRSIMVLVRGWCTSVQVLERQDEIVLRRERVEMLERQVRYARTDEGLDLEARRQFGAGPPGEIWVTIEAEEPRPQALPPRAIGERVSAWLSDTGARWVDDVRGVAAVLRYWVGIDQVSEPPPLDPDVSAAAAAEPEPEAEAEPAADDDTAQE